MAILVQKYNPQNANPAIPSPSVAQVSPAAFGTGVYQAGEQLGAAMSGLGKQIAEHAISIQVQKDQAAVLSNETALRQDLQNMLYDPNTGIMNTQGHGTANITQNYDKAAQGIFEKYSKNMQSPMMQAEFKKAADQALINARQTVSLHEAQQTRQAMQQDVQTNINQMASEYLQNPHPGAFTLLSSQLESKLPYVQSLYGMSADTAKQTILTQASAAAVSAAKFYAGQGDVNSLESLVKETTGKITGGAASDIKTILQPLKQNVEVMKEVSPMFTDPSNKNPDGTLNQDKLIQAWEARHGINSTKTVQTTGEPSYEQFKNALIGQESGGNYETGANSFGASGAYQMIPSTWQSGLKVLGLPADTPQTKENQDKVADALLKPLFDKYGARGAAVAWYSGEQNASRVLAGQNPIGDNGSEYSADAKQDDGQGNKTAPSVNEYAAQVLSRTGVQAGPQTVSNYNQTIYEQGLTQIKRTAAESVATHRQQLEQQFNTWDQYLITTRPTTLDQIQQAAEQFGFQGSDLTAAINKGLSFSGQLKVADDRKAYDNFENALHDIHEGAITNKADLDARYSGLVPWDKLITLENSLTKESKWANSENMGRFNAVAKELGIDSVEKSRMYEKINQQAQAYNSKNITVTADDIETWAREQGQKTVLTGSWPQRTNGILADVPAGWTWTGNAWVDPNGVKPTSYENGKFYTTVNGVKVEMRP